MVSGRPRLARVRHWVLRGVLVGGAAGAALLLAGPAQADGGTPPSPVTGLVAGLTGTVEQTSSGALDAVTTVVGDLPVVAQLPVRPVLDDAGAGVGGAVGGVTQVVDRVVSPVATEVDAVVVDVVAPVVEVVRPPADLPGSEPEAPDRPVAEAPAGSSADVSPGQAVSAPTSARVVETRSPATGTAHDTRSLLAGDPAPVPGATAASVPASMPAGELPAPRGQLPPVAPSGTSGSASPGGSGAGPDLLASPGGHLPTRLDPGSARALPVNQTACAATDPTPPFSPD